MSDSSTPPPAQPPISLVDPGVPADQGLSSLGLIMQLCGTVLAAAGTLALFGTLLTRGDGSEKLWVLLVLGLSVTRSAFHRVAGTELLYGKRGFDGAQQSALAGLRRYCAIGLGHSVALFMILTGKFHVDLKLGFAIGVGFAVWPAALLAISALPRFSRFNGELPLSEDKGFEGASILMTVLGACGVLIMGTFLLIMLQSGGRMLTQGPGVLIMLAVVLLVIRSCLHVQAGVSGLRETSIDRSVELANRYANFGVISAFCAGGALLLLLMTMRLEPSALVGIAAMCWMLLAWPLIIRRFFSERQFADLMAGEQANLHRRSPDAGLSGLGWLLFALAMANAALVVPMLLVPPQEMPGDISRTMAMLAGAGVMHSMWFGVALTVLQAWAGFELIRMSSTARWVATAYAVVTIVIQLYVSWPMLKMLQHLGMLGMNAIAMYIPMAISLVIPVVTLVLVNRNIAPSARARFRTPPVQA